MFFKVNKPPQWMLDNLLKEDRAENCPDCQAEVGESHSESCDTARCMNTGIQRIQCCCVGGCGDDKWNGHWPGIETAHRRGLVCFDTATGYVMLDLNAAAIADQMEKCGASEEDIDMAIEIYGHKQNSKEES